MWYKTLVPQSEQPLIRHRRWSLAALMVKYSWERIFGLPSKVASMTGRQSPVAFYRRAESP